MTDKLEKELRDIFSVPADTGWSGEGGSKKLSLQHTATGKIWDNQVTEFTKPAEDDYK